MRRLTKSQEGVALPVATAMMLVISLFVVAFFSVTLQVNETSIDDRSSKRALAAAEAGLQTALYRMNRIPTSDPLGTQCFTTAWVSRGGDGQCPPATVSLGNGASVTYYVTPELETTGLCLGVLGLPTDRCITAVGTAGGVDRRVQLRASRLTGPPSYKSVGLMSKSLMYAGNSSEITSDVGANGHVHFGNSAKTYANSSAGIVGGIFYPPGGTYDTSGSGQEIAANPDRQPVATPYAFDPIDFEPAEIAAQQTNLKTSPLWTIPGASGSYTYDPTTKYFTVLDGKEITLPGGTYYFCRFYMENSSKLKFSTTQATQIYVDSPSRDGSLCTTTTTPQWDGTFWLNNSNEFNKDGREDLVEVFVHGTDWNGTRSNAPDCTPAGNTHPDAPPDVRCKSDVLLNNSSGFEGMIYAPGTTVELNNSGKMKGAIAADEIRFNNSVVFELTDAVKDSAPATTGGINRGNWLECRPASDPLSAC